MRTNKTLPLKAVMEKVMKDLYSRGIITKAVFERGINGKSGKVENVRKAA